MKTIDKIILSTILLGIIINLASERITTTYPFVKEYATIVIIFLLSAWIGFHLIRLIFILLKSGRFAVTVIVINKKREFLVIKHPYHHCYLSPGGRLSYKETPQEAAINRLKEETGINYPQFHPRYHGKVQMLSDSVELGILPFQVQTELRRQRGFVPFHYTFLYVVNYEDDKLPDLDGAKYKPKWMSIKELRSLPRAEIPFDDMLKTYELLLADIAYADVYKLTNMQAYNQMAFEYDERVELYKENDKILLQPFIELIKQTFPSENMYSFIDVGCGAGLNLSMLYDEGFDVTGIDFSSEMIRLSKNECPHARLIEGDFLETSFENQTFHAILCKAFIHLFPKLLARNIIGKFYQMLLPNGVLLLTTSRQEEELEGIKSKDDFKSKAKRFRASWNSDELIKLLNIEGFNIINSNVTKDEVFKKYWITILVSKP